MELQKINVKLFVDAPSVVPLEPFLDIFARWRDNESDPSGWIDLADYAHVAKGPGVMLIGQRGSLATDLGDPGPGLLYANKQGLEGPLEDRVGETFRRALVLLTQLTREPDYPRELVPRPGFWEISFNDRLSAPNTDTTDRIAQPAVQAVCERMFRGRPFVLVRQADPLRRYGFTLHCDTIDALGPALEALDSG